jgi:6,7-dimethyl-8-ribityllumazine synthase
MQELISHSDGGILIFPAMQEGRGIGLVDKARAYKIQAEGVDTYNANKVVGHCEDARTYVTAGRILKKLKINRIILLTQNVEKINELRRYVEVEVRPLIVESTVENAFYMETKLKRHAANPSAITDELTKEQKMNTVLSQEYGDLSDKKIALVYASWHTKFIEQIRSILRDTIIHCCKVPPRIVEVAAPGSNEVPFAASRLAIGQNAPHGIICIGILLKGDTLHFESVSNAVACGIMQAQIFTQVPMMNCILSCYTLEQIIERISGEKSTLPYIAHSLLQLIV